MEQIVISKEISQKVNGIVSATYLTSKAKNSALRHLVGGLCCSCAAVPTRRVIYSPMKDCKLLEFYCDNCFKNFK